MSMTSKMVQGHSDVGRRDKLKTSGTKKRWLGRHICVHTFGYCYFHVHDKNDIVKIRMRQCDKNSIREL